MVAPIRPTQEMGEPEVRLRRGFFGKLICAGQVPHLCGEVPLPPERRVD